MAKIKQIRKLFSDLSWKEILTSGYFISTLVFAVLIWLVGPAVNSVLTADGSFWSRLTQPQATSVVIRFLASLLFLLFGLVGSAMMIHYRRQQHELLEQREQTASIISSEPECVKTVARDGILLDMNPAGLKIVEAETLEMVQHRSVFDLIAPEDRQRYIEFNDRVFTGNREQIQYDIIGLNGTRKHVDSHAVPLFNRQGEVTAHLAITRDITEFKQSQEQLLRFSLAIEQSASMVMITDLGSSICYVNSRFCEVTGYQKEECIGQTPAIIQSAQTSRKTLEHLDRTIHADKEWRGQLQNRCKDGALFWASVVISPIRNADGVTTHFLSTQEDITHTQNLVDELNYKNSHCTLTGLVNRSAFENRMRSVAARSMIDDSSHSVLFIDIDQFKLINDTCGHLAGDQLLIQVAHLLRDGTRQQDSVARLSGDEFAVLLEYVSPGEALQYAQQLKQAVESFVLTWKDQNYHTSVSIGIACINNKSASVTGILKNADTACYLAKGLGRNRVQVYSDDESTALHYREMNWVARIHQGIEHDRFCLYAQKIVGLNRVEQGLHLEILIRYQQDETVVAPIEFLPAAERYGLAPKLDRWVINKLFRTLQHETGFQRRLALVSVNLSGLSLADQQFLEFVEQQFCEYQIDPGMICFEITETAAISNLNTAVDFITRLKQLGCSFALDDFGSGLSSFGYLKRLPVDYLKIDGIFVKDIAEDKIDLAMVRSINDIGHLMGKQTIAEFVEDDAIRAHLRSLNVDFGQGYGIDRPQPLQTFIDDNAEKSAPGERIKVEPFAW
ncbi:putative bifunctional diguanylate cyclase/phosphodiesterase [Amphritea sp. HPY]|uniref:putative bifunctional diguanylate cyclase/phosphodiesterase n=1 Tax=Amphritea sp. HPY TaxID=3421652 RepID=UPI003D7D4772